MPGASDTQEMSPQHHAQLGAHHACRWHQRQRMGWPVHQSGQAAVPCWPGAWPAPTAWQALTSVLLSCLGVCLASSLSAGPAAAGTGRSQAAAAVAAVPAVSSASQHDADATLAVKQISTRHSHGRKLCA